MNADYMSRNAFETARLRSLRSLSDEELGQEPDEGWTLSMILGHVGYMEIRGVGAIAAWKQYGLRLELWVSAEHVVNDLRADFWKAIPPRASLEQCIKAAETMDDLVANLTASEAAQVAAQRPRVLERAIHRGEHLAEIERMLGRTIEPAPSK